MRDDNWQQQQQQEAEQWLVKQWEDAHKGWFECVYCGKVYQEQPRTCCRETHFFIIGGSNECA